ncbi:hypothetical protein AURDEDRAFT_174636 [Auricularia subglabra TFB-10046 SS5]|uniref:Uncharacterized protein n=1 Tax=Auricularia subglabra (strain TFB-10046 / SS5) TaxID=717982 RepID=J0D968_AURST|nr:hypothetical protein AURDEDRAFT_174636 [Auricularia subglabra TFB-10046 SS5]
MLVNHGQFGARVCENGGAASPLFESAVDALLRCSAGVHTSTLGVQQSTTHALLSIAAPAPPRRRDRGVPFGVPLAGVRALRLSGRCPDAASLVWATRNARSIALHGDDSESADVCVCAIRNSA